MQLIQLAQINQIVSITADIANGQATQKETVGSNKVKSDKTRHSCCILHFPSNREQSFQRSAVICLLHSIDRQSAADSERLYELISDVMTQGILKCKW